MENKANKKSKIEALKTKFSSIKQNRLYEPISYVFFGGLTTLVSWLSYWLFIRLFNSILQNEVLIFNLAQAFSFAISVSFAFFTNKKYVFFSKGDKKQLLKELILFFSFRISSYIIFDILAYNLFVFGFKINHYLAKIISNILIVIFNYFSSKLLIFRTKSNSKKA